MAEATPTPKHVQTTLVQAASKSETSFVNRVPSLPGGPGKTPYGTPYNHQDGHSNGAGVTLLTQGLQGLGFNDSIYGTGNRSNHIAGPSGHFTPFGMNNNMSPQYWTNNIVSGHPFGNNGGMHPAAIYSPATGHYVANGYHNNSPMSSAWTPMTTNGELPNLITPRRESVSSLENDTPSTPIYPGYPMMPPGGVTILNRSPSGAFTTSTPSPLQIMTNYSMSMTKAPEVEAISPRLKMIVTKEPAIPPAIPAPSSPLKPLDRALENVRGETNVYIRGLMPETSDAMLDNWGRRFGDIKSSKSIIDHGTGLCKGFGFVRFHNFKDAEDCIRGFHHLGYEVSFARESFYSKLKAIADDSNTNLYVSNLPKTMNEHELASIFSPHKVCSARILRNSNGTGRGVGFARFESRDDCDEIIKNFNNKIVIDNDEEHTIQIRFADTQEQKHLKQTTTAARQFRSAEYEFATQAQRNGWFANDRISISGQSSVSPSVHDLEPFVGQSNSRGPNPSDPGLRGLLRTPLTMLSPNASNSRFNITAASTPMVKGLSKDSRDGGIKLQTADKENAVAEGDASPTRPKSKSEK